ncbi:MAG: response regulator transcription factor [Chitinophagales bacterium]
MSKTILLVDDEQDIVEFLKYNLLKENYQIFTANNGIKALELAKKHNPDLIVLDVMMPEMGGIETCRKLRKLAQFEKTIIAFLTAKSADEFVIEGFETGADDYISKPIRPKVFVSRVKALLKRNKEAKEENSKRKFDSIIIDTEKRIIKKENEIISTMPKKQFEILVLLSSKPERYFSREEIYANIWGEDIIVGDRTLDVHIRKLREQIGEAFIKTSKGIGYAFIP